MFSPDVFCVVVERLIRVLDPLGIRYHLTGGITAVHYSEPRLTQDLDVVIDPFAAAKQIDLLVPNLTAHGYLFDATVVRDAIANCRPFQLFDTNESLKIDIYPRELIAGEISRSVEVELFTGLIVPIVSLTDLTLSKLIWISKGSHKSRRDVRQLYKRSTDTESQTILAHADQIGLRTLLNEVLVESDEIVE
jgi:hypothetical protein